MATGATKGLAQAIGRMFDEWVFVGKCLTEYGWPPLSITHGPDMADVAAAVRRADGEDRRLALDDLMDAHYHAKRINKVVSTWRSNPMLERRLPIIEQVNEAYGAGLHYLVPPTLYAQMEGLVAEAFAVKGRLSSGGLDRLMSKLIETNFELPGDHAARSFWKTQVHVSFEHGSDLQSNVSRHAIVHGADVTYGTAMNSLRSFLFFDHVQMCLQNALIVVKGVGHAPMCPEIQGATNGFEFARHRRYAPIWTVSVDEYCALCKGRSAPGSFETAMNRIDDSNALSGRAADLPR